jgi:hypothetical protein
MGFTGSPAERVTDRFRESLTETGRRGEGFKFRREERGERREERGER